MRRRSHRSLTALVAVVSLLPFPSGLLAQQDKVAALKQSLAANGARQKQYKWVETTVISMKGEEKSRIQKQCSYGPDGKVQKQPLSAPPPQEAAPGGMKGKIAAKKKEEITATMNQAVALIHEYVPPDSQKIQAAKTAGALAIVPAGPNGVRLDLRNYVKKGDSFSLSLDTGKNVIQTVSVKSYLETTEDAVGLDVTFAMLKDGLSYPESIVLNVPGEKIQVVIQNSNYQKVAPPPPPAAKPAASAAAPSAAFLDTITGPIALYPDALIAQILMAATDFPALQTFAGWLGKNASLKGTELQTAAQKAGFAACLIALAPFAQVVQMMVEKPDWTKQLGKAFTADKSAVFESIQRLRAQAQALGNLKTTPQQEVVTETTSTGQQVIVIQPANPQVVYVPVYSTQVVYVQPAPPPPPPSASSSDVAAAAVLGFTVGIIIGSASNDYYYGPYAWRGGGMYNEAWDRREDYVEDRQDYRQDKGEDRQDYRQDNPEAAQANQAQRQSTAQSTQSQRQSTAQSTQSSRQTAASTSSAGSGQAASQRSGSSAGVGGYQSGSSARAQSARGSSSRSSSAGRRR